MLRYIIVFLIQILWIIFLTGVGFIVGRETGLILMGSIGILSFLVSLFFSDKIFLVLLEARKPSGIQPGAGVIRNFCFKNGYSHINSFKSFRFHNSIFLLTPLIGSPTLIIGSSLEKMLSPEEFKLLIELSLKHLTRGGTGFRSQASVTIMTVASPLLVVDFLLKGRIRGIVKNREVEGAFLKNLLYVMFVPFFILKGFLLKNHFSRFENDAMKDPLLRGSLFKLRAEEPVKTRYIFEYFLDDVSIIRNKEFNLINAVMASSGHRPEAV